MVPSLFPKRPIQIEELRQFTRHKRDRSNVSISQQEWTGLTTLVKLRVIYRQLTAISQL
jgi:hypothetical protein